MKTPFLSWLSAILLLIASVQESSAQVTFVDNSFPPYNFNISASTGTGQIRTTTNPPIPVPVPRSDETGSWSVMIHKPETDRTTQGYVAIYPGDNNGNLGRDPISQSNIVVSWGSPSGGQVHAFVSGRCALGPGSLTGFVKVYAVFFASNTGSNGTRLATSPGIPLLFPTSPQPPMGRPIITALSPSSGTAGSRFTISGTNLSNIIQITFGGTNVGTNLSVTVPNGTPLGSYPVVVTNSVGSSDAVTFTVTPSRLGEWLPCGGRNPDICSDQCVPYGSLPALIKGRVLADEGSQDFRNYVAVARSEGVAPFADGDEHEWAQWQYSYNNINFYDINGNDEGRDFQPWPCYGTTYYRRVSSHRYYGGIGSRRRHWYTSNVVTITPTSPPPTPTQSIYYACSNVENTFTIDFTPGAAATSTCWSLPSASWRVNGGQGVNGQNCHNVGDVRSVTITVPAGTAPGTYEIHISSNGPCGEAGYRSIPVVVGSSPSPDVISGPAETLRGLTYTYSLTGSSSGSNYNWDVPVGWNIISGQGTRLLTARAPTFEAQGNMSVTYTNPCGGSSNANLFVITIVRPQPCILCEEPVLQGLKEDKSQAIYPNPAIDEITLALGGKEAQATFYDAQGETRKVVQLNAKLSLNKISVRDLPAGLYYVRIVSEGEPIMEKQLLIHR